MKRQKRNRVARAYSRGYLAGIEGKSRDICPFAELDARSSWMNGWREGRTDQIHGYTGVAGVQNLQKLGS